VDLAINDDPTYTDVLFYLSTFLRKKTNYLELGVSVGKNFFQLCNAFHNALLIGLDIEEINPRLENNLANRRVLRQWEMAEELRDFRYATEDSSVRSYVDDSLAHSRKGLSSLNSYSYRDNNIIYLSSNIYDDEAWMALKGRKFNIIFSDALHEAAALLYEYEKLTQYNLIDGDEFIYVWDDLQNKDMEAAALQIARDLALNHPGVHGRLLSLNGWLGEHETRHKVGIVASLQER